MCTNFDGSVGRCNRCRTSAVRRLLWVASRVSRSLFSPLTSRGLLFRCSAAFLLQVQLQETIRDVKTLHNQNLVAVAQKKYVYIYDNQGAEVRRRGPSNRRTPRARRGPLVGGFALVRAQHYIAANHPAAAKITPGCYLVHKVYAFHQFVRLEVGHLTLFVERLFTSVCHLCAPLPLSPRRSLPLSAASPLC